MTVEIKLDEEGYYLLSDCRQWILAKERKKYSKPQYRFDNIGYYIDLGCLCQGYVERVSLDSNAKTPKALMEVIYRASQALSELSLSHIGITITSNKTVLVPEKDKDD